jgi:nitrogenase molybdenum-iron protein beta chain
MACNVTERQRAGIINPIFTCQPAGAQFASIGIKDCIGIVHGGQGCVMFVRLIFSQHFKESFELASSSVHEEGAVFGALKRVEEGVDVLLMRYPHVKVIPIISTCSTEIIGDDIDGLVVKLNEGLLREKYSDRDVHLIPIHSPSFVGSMISGYDSAVRDIVKYFATKGEPNGKINRGVVTALMHLLNELYIEATVLFEIEEFDSPLMPSGQHVSHGETTIEDLKSTANAAASIALNRYEGGKAAKYLEEEHGVPATLGPTPIGIRNTDSFLQTMKQITGKPIPSSLVKERGIAIDALTDLTHMFLAEKKVAIYGNPDLVIGLAQFCIDLEMKPTLLLLGDDNPFYVDDPRIKELQENVDWDMNIITNADLFEMEERIKNNGLELDLILGHSKGRFAAIDHKIPMVRVGFPTYDRAGMFRHPVVGYAGAIWLAEQMANALFTDMEYKGTREWSLNVW